MRTLLLFSLAVCLNACGSIETGPKRDVAPIKMREEDVRRLEDRLERMESALKKEY